jgi:hypothetical protein
MIWNVFLSSAEYAVAITDKTLHDAKVPICVCVCMYVALRKLAEEEQDA